MSTQIITNQIADDAVDSDKLDVSDNYTFTGEVSGEDPTSDAHFATKSYVDGLVASNVYWKAAVKAATDDALSGAYAYNNGVITFNANGAFPAIDGVTLSVNDRVLIKDEDASLAPNNGIYILSTIGDSENPAVLTRSDDMNASDEFKGAAVVVLQGTANDNAQFVCSNDSNPTVGTTDITFVQIGNGSVTGGNGITVSGNSVAVDLATTSALAFDSSKLKVNVGNGIEIVSDALKAKLKSGGGLVVDSDGIAIGSGVISDTNITSSGLSGSALADGAVGSDQIASLAVTEGKLGNGSVTVNKLGSGSVSEAKLSFQAYQKLSTGNGSATTIDLDYEVNSKFQKMILVFRNGLALNEAASPSNVDEYSVALTGGASGVTRLTFGAAPSSSDSITIRYIA